MAKENMERRFYQIEWDNGTTDVFLDRDEAVAYYADAEDLYVRAMAGTLGSLVTKPESPGAMCIWSDAAINLAANV